MAKKPAKRAKRTAPRKSAAISNISTEQLFDLFGSEWAHESPRFRMGDLDFVVVDVDAGVPLAEREAYAAAQQRQLREHFAPLWDGLGESSCVRAATPATPPLAGEVEIRLQKTVTMQGALAYHDCKPDGTPICYVFTELIEQAGDTWTSAASHEVLETMGDARLHLCVELDDGTIWDREVCFTGDTKISLLNGTEVAIEDLVGLDHFWVYSTTPSGEIVPGRGHAARLTRNDAEIVAVELDNGEVVRCTPDHRFQLRDGSYCKAAALQPGTSLMPLYRRRAPIAVGNPLDYEQILNPADREWKFTHRVVNTRCPPGYVRHHADFNRFNNERLAVHNRCHGKKVEPSCVHCATPNNHKVVSVTAAGCADVYDFSVDDHHNFALSAGVFVHNCDRVESGVVMVDGVPLSNFNTPAAFEPPKDRDGIKYDYLGQSTKPNQVLEGGYAQRFDPRKGWTQVGAMRAYRASLHALGVSRGARRKARHKKPWFARVISTLAFWR